jgi:hypothetical protein
MSNQIKYIKHSDIDSEKWAQCIENAQNSRIYANIWHLDRTAIVWDALVFGDYEFVMPLPVRKKYGFSYVYQPLFCQQLGIFPEPPASVAGEFYNTLFDKFRYVDIHLNARNPSIQKKEELDFLPRHNYLLDLHYNYKSLERSYSTNTKRNIAKADKNNLQYISGIRLEDYLAFKNANLTDKVSKKNIEKLKSIIAFGQYKGIGEIYGVYSTENEMCAAVYFCRWKNRVIYLNAATSEKGKKLGAMYFLVDNFIRANAERNLQLDFEGSMIPGVARFYSGFGATPETYFQLKFNRLPLPFKWLKRN